MKSKTEEHLIISICLPILTDLLKVSAFRCASVDCDYQALAGAQVHPSLSFPFSISPSDWKCGALQSRSGIFPTRRQHAGLRGSDCSECSDYVVYAYGVQLQPNQLSATDSRALQ